MPLSWSQMAAAYNSNRFSSVSPVAAFVMLVGLADGGGGGEVLSAPGVNTPSPAKVVMELSRKTQAIVIARKVFIVFPV